MDGIRVWPPDDRSLDFFVDAEPNYQPYLRRLLGSPCMNEAWKPSATHMEMVPNPVSLNKIGVAAHSLQELV